MRFRPFNRSGVPPVQPKNAPRALNKRLRDVDVRTDRLPEMEDPSMVAEAIGAGASVKPPKTPGSSGEPGKKGSGLWNFVKGAGKLGLLGLGGVGAYGLYKDFTDSEMKQAREAYDSQKLLSLLNGEESATLGEGSLSSMLGFDASMLEGAMDYKPGRSVRVRPSSDFQSLLSESDLMRLQQLRMRQQRTKSEILADLGVYDEGMGF